MARIIKSWFKNKKGGKRAIISFSEIKHVRLISKPSHLIGFNYSLIHLLFFPKVITENILNLHHMKVNV